MSVHTAIRGIGAASIVFAVTSAAIGQTYILGVQSSPDRVVQLNAFDGSVINDSFILPTTGGPFAFSTPTEAIQVNDEIWVSDQLEDSLFRFDLAGNYLSTITGGMDNIRGIAFANNTVYVSNSGSGNGAPGDAIIRFDTNGVNLGNTSAGDPFDVEPYNGGLLVSNISGDNLDFHDLNGNYVSTFHDSDGMTGIDFPEQVHAAASGAVLAAGFSAPDGLYVYDSTGTQTAYFADTANNGIITLGNGNYLYSNSSGFSTLDPVTGATTSILSGSGRYFSLVVIPEPSSLAGLAAAGLMLRRRR